MNEGQSVVLGDSDDNDELVRVEDDNEELLELVEVGGVLDKIRSYVYSPIPEDSAARVHCRFPEHVDILCDYIASKEDLRYTRIYPAIVVIGYGVRMHNLKEEGRDIISDISDILKSLRLSRIRSDRLFVKGVNNVTIRFQGDRHNFRFESELVAQVSDTAKLCGALSSDLYLYYFLIGIKELVEREDSLSEMADFEEFKQSMFDLKYADDKLNAYKVSITCSEVC